MLSRTSSTRMPSVTTTVAAAMISATSDHLCSLSTGATVLVEVGRQGGAATPSRQKCRLTPSICTPPFPDAAPGAKLTVKTLNVPVLSLVKRIRLSSWESLVGRHVVDTRGVTTNRRFCSVLCLVVVAELVVLPVAVNDAPSTLSLPEHIGP